MSKKLTLHKMILQLEKKLLQPELRKSAEEIENILADDFIEFGSSGKIYDKNQIIESLRNESPKKIEIDNFKITELSSTIVLATYKSLHNTSANSKTISLRSSVWQLIDGKWRIVFHQGTTQK